MATKVASYVRYSGPEECGDEYGISRRSDVEPLRWVPQLARLGDGGHIPDRRASEIPTNR